MADFNKTANKWNQVKLKAIGKISPNSTLSMTMGQWPHKPNDRTYTVTNSPMEALELNSKLKENLKFKSFLKR